jgi:hypothetical protein
MGGNASRLQKRSDLSPRNFEAAKQHEWETSPFTAHFAVFNSIPRRLRECIAITRGPTHYKGKSRDLDRLVCNQHNYDSTSLIVHLDVSIFPPNGGSPQRPAKLNGNSSNLGSPQPRPPKTAPPRCLLKLSTFLFTSAATFRRMPPSAPGVLARRCRLVHGAKQLDSARKAALECEVTARVVRNLKLAR